MLGGAGHGVYTEGGTARRSENREYVRDVTKLNYSHYLSTVATTCACAPHPSPV